jgi:hypothetical protein
MNRTTHFLSLAFWGILGLMVTLGALQPVQAQTGPSLRSVDRPVQVALDPVYQYYETSDGTILSEASTRLSASVPIGQRFTAQAQVGYARMGGDPTQVQGLTDATGRFMYAQPMAEGSVVMSATVNVPVGKSELDSDEFRTTRFISRNFYDFEVSSFSRGPSISPRVTYARPINDQLAIGVGVSYQHYRGYEPRANGEEYVPGDGIGGNVGLNYKLSETSAVGADLAFRRYSTDELDGQTTFDAGNRISGTARYLRRSGFTTIRVLARYARWGESEFSYQIGTPDQGRVIPSHAMVLGGYKTRLTDMIDLRARVSGYRYTDTEVADTKTFGRAYVSPSFEVTEQIAVAPHGTATYGSYLGLGGGLRIEGEF